MHEVLQKFACRVVDQLAVHVEKLVGAADIGFRLRHRWGVQEHQRLPQVVIGSASANAARRCADDSAGLPFQAL
jgi:hypothetical protein